MRKQNNGAQCTLCPRSCLIPDGGTGACGARKNIDGELYSLNYGFVSLAIDPVEKKPLFHWRPGSRILSIGSFGCNLFCPFCQNHHLSRSRNGSGLETFSPEDIILFAIEEGLGAVAFTYNEPVVGFEFVVETSMLLRKNNLASVLVTNGFVERKPMEELFPFVDAMNIDLKGFSEEVYSNLGGSLGPVLKTIQKAFSMGIHLEITHLMVPGINDSEEDFISMAGWISDISRMIPLHVTAYHPAYKWERPRTSANEIISRVKAASRELHYVYTGNLGLKNETLCPNCGATVISRDPAGNIVILNSENGSCKICNTSLGIVTK
jgi:pyruvate formate lyase activating enzyme